MKQRLFFLLAGLCVQTILLAQAVTIRGKVTSKETGQPIAAASVMVKGAAKGALAGEDGAFALSVKALPVTVAVSSIGFEPLELEVKTGDDISVSLQPQSLLTQGVVVGASRVPMRILDAPVSIERIGAATIATAPATSYYDIAAYKKGIDLTTSSLTFKTISTRGFNGSGSARVNQLVDGMDNQAPGLNFFVGNFAGLTELDVESMELLPGASSALYGPGGMNGTVLINSKNPFDYPGLSVQLKEGLMHVDKRQRGSARPYHDFSLRWAQVLGTKWAFKIGAQYISATDWLASDSSNYSRAGIIGKTIGGTRATDPNYDGVNVYGDETSVGLAPIKQIMANMGLLPQSILPFIPDMSVSRTGYAESDVLDPETKNIKLSGALHYKLTPKLQAQLMGYWATGNTVYTGNDRYALKNIVIGQYKLELKHDNWFVRSYTTQEDAGDAYSSTVAMQYFNEAWKPSQLWYPEYIGAYATGAGGIVQQVMGAGGSAADAMAAVQGAATQLHNAARAYADRNRPAAGSADFKKYFDAVANTPIPNGGRFLEKSQLWMTEGQYNFSNQVSFAEIIVGGNWKKYVLDSDGTLFIDTLKPITIMEAGGYVQVSKKLFAERLTLSASGRYDKNEDFKGRFTPRATALVKLADNNNLRFSYQTAYRFPSTQQKYIRLKLAEYTLLGGLPWIMDFMNATKNPVVELVDGVPAAAPYQYKELKPESVQSFELGYKGLLKNKLLVDAYGYWGRYQDFLGRNVLYQPATGQVFSTVVNSSTKVKSYGFGLGFDYLLTKKLSLFANGYSDVLTDLPTGFQAYFNTPKYRANAGVSANGLGSKQQFGFSAMWHWQDGFYSDGDLASGPVAAFSTVDAVVSYKVPQLKSTFKLGGTNVFNHYYKNAFANPEVGAIYYVSYAYNLMK
jgi:outer membrane receptor protein involved in Fe transport